MLVGNQLQIDQVHIWSFSISEIINENRYRYLFNIERDNFREDHDHNIYIVNNNKFRKKVLLVLLKRYLGIDIQEINFYTNKFGKPLMDPNINNNIFFNYSSSNDMLFFAFSINRQVGIDVEKIQNDTEIIDIANRYFPKDARNSILSNSGEKQLLDFYKIWTRIEAFSKAIGYGVKLLEFRNWAKVPIQRSNIRYEKKIWGIRSIEFDQSYAASLAFRGRNVEIFHYYLNDLNKLFL